MFLSTENALSVCWRDFLSVGAYLVVL